MLDRLWGALVLPFFLGLAASWLIEALLRPRPRPPWRRPLAANLTHAGVWLLAFALEVALFQRPYFAVANVLAIELVLVVVSLAKYRSLQEPFVYPDFEYFLDAMRHPRLYLPFLGWGVLIGLCSGYGVALWMGLKFEASLLEQACAGHTYLAAALLALAGLALAVLAGRRLNADFEAGVDLRRMGLIAALWAYGRAERQPVAELSQYSPFAVGRPAHLPAELPDLVTIQSESFFDVRDVYPIVNKDVLAGFDALCAEAISHGPLKVAARGANTVRSEFAFLSGLASDGLGVHRYNPYRRLVKGGFPTIASYLRDLGYRTICVHPYHREFYRRERVLPLLGFDEFIGIEAFDVAQKAGSYIGDEAVGQYVSMLLRREDCRPMYVHVITMENHGPLHWEEVSEADIRAYLNGPLPRGCADLVAYARHLRNADAMFVTLRDTLMNNGRLAGLCVFGDHVPIMPKVYEALGEVSGATSAAIWATDWATDSRAGEQQNLDISGLAVKFLTYFRLLSHSDSIRTKQ